MVTAKVTVGILQHINVSNQQVVHLRLAQCYVPITVSQLSQRMRWGGGGSLHFPNAVNLLSSINNLLYSLLLIAVFLVTI